MRLDNCWAPALKLVKVIAKRMNNADKLILLLIKLINSYFRGLETCAQAVISLKASRTIAMPYALVCDAKVLQPGNPTKLFKHL